MQKCQTFACSCFLYRGGFLYKFYKGVAALSDSKLLVSLWLWVVLLCWLCTLCSTCACTCATPQGYKSGCITDWKVASKSSPIIAHLSFCEGTGSDLFIYFFADPPRDPEETLPSKCHLLWGELCQVSWEAPENDKPTSVQVAKPEVQGALGWREGTISERLLQKLCLFSICPGAKHEASVEVA